MDTTYSIMVLAVARLAGIEPEELAREMLDDDLNVEYAGELVAASVIERTKRGRKEE